MGTETSQIVAVPYLLHTKDEELPLQQHTAARELIRFCNIPLGILRIAFFCPKAGDYHNCSSYLLPNHTAGITENGFYQISFREVKQFSHSATVTPFSHQ